MADVGSISLMMSFVVIIYSIIAYIVGLKQQNKRLVKSAQNGVLANTILVTVASLSLLYLLATSDFSIEYVAQYTNRTLPMIYKLSAFWAGNTGSLLLWFWVLSIYGAIVAFSKNPVGAKLKPYASVVMLLIGLFFSLLLNFDTSPFAPLGFVAQDGAGLNPMLQNIGMVIHPLTQFLGYVGLAVPFAYLMADLFLGEKGASWIKVTRRWVLFTWLFLTIGMVSGGEWAYVELGWGGYWAWDPVENASLMPWLTVTAFMHSVMIQEKQGTFKIWNVLLMAASFLLTIVGTFITRSGILASVHAFAEGRTGFYFLIFMFIIVVVTLFLFFKRFKSLRSESSTESLISKESSFLINNILMVVISVVVLWGTFYPLISEAIYGVQITVGEGFFNQTTIPFWIAMVILMGLCPLLPWRKSSTKGLKKKFGVPLFLSHIFGFVLFFIGIRDFYPVVTFAASFFVLVTIVQEFWQGVRARKSNTGEGVIRALLNLVGANRRRYGGFIIHIAVIMMVVGITGSSAYQEEVLVTAERGEVIETKNYEMTYNGLQVAEDPHSAVVYAEMDVYRNGNFYATLRPAQEYFGASAEQDSSAQVDFKSGIREDLYIILSGWDESGDTATFEVVVNPLVSWIFWGMRLMVIGTAIALWPDRGHYSRMLLKERYSVSKEVS
ncbi:heme lyase CcmF/NrfE family subunit [Fuchsiella alkaliacetigena]|uniref:heme lyase CcmF/NrfE family subunit n=1 Tax=Fuchsiella alkaliacetigena TaxID=957042 RepID=UPI00200B8ADD|nr:heme lyase CcmF/NrfE family subunit [Fuchsiella alkaliacetigena]MCK8825180.1 heme lyase CcmF/NrfE family subunit [Fuchsiella alkaliacetigena]